MAFDYFDEFSKIIKALNDAKVEYVLIGGFAVLLHGFPRFTQDVDLFVAVASENVERLRDALNSVYADSSIKEITTGELNEYSVLRYCAPSGFVVDIIARLGEMFMYEDVKYEIMDYNGLKIRVATPEILLKMKQDTLRDKDKIDAGFLRGLVSKKKEGK